MKLKKLIKTINIRAVQGNLDSDVAALALHSGHVKEKGLFFAVVGASSDGHKYIDTAIRKGARTIVCERLPAQLHDDVTYVHVERTEDTIGPIAATFFGHPSTKLKVVGVTGTNGKTTVATLLAELFNRLGYTTGLFSTIINKIGDNIVTTKLTTDDPITLQELLAKMVESGCTHCFMEVSSHAISQGRIRGIDFTGAIFTNITHDHLDYHTTFEAYMQAKQGFFNMLHSHTWALANFDDENGEFMLQNTKAAKYWYGLCAPEKVCPIELNFEGRIISSTLEGLLLRVNNYEITSSLVGKFNAYNLLAIFGAARLLDEDIDTLIPLMGELHSAPGRMERIVGKKKIAFVDYAHTPDAVLNVLTTINELKHPSQRIITVIGCGGDRDRTKRPLMARIAAELSSYVILTADNPRSESPLAIIEEMKSGIHRWVAEHMFEVPDRKEALETAVTVARENDIILVAGKGHEAYQEIEGVQYDFDDRKIMARLLEVSDV